MPLRFALSLLAVLLTVATSVRAQTYVEFFSVPGDPTLHGLDYHDGALWVVVRSSSEPQLLQIDPDNGSVLSTIALGEAFPTPLGVAWDGANFRLSESFTSSPDIFSVDPAGTVLDQIPAPSQLSNGLAFHDGTLFVSKAYPDDEAAIVGVDPATGDVLETIPFPSTQPGGIAFLGDGTFWTTNVGDDSGDDLEVLWRIDRATGEVLDTLEVPTGAGRPRGLAYDGSQFLYAVMDEPGGFDDVIYKIDLATEGTPVYSAPVEMLDFGTVAVGDEGDAGFGAQNTGDAPLEISNVAVTGPDSGLFTTSLIDRTVEPGTGFLVVVYFEPEAYGPRSATLSFETNDVANQIVEIPLTALGVFPEPGLGFAEAGHDFGAVRIEDPYGDTRSERLWPLRLINQGRGTLDVTALTIEGDDAFFVYDDSAFPLSIATADTATVHVGFRPPTVGSFDADLIAESNSAGPSVVVQLSGEGVDPEIEGGDALWTLTVPDNPNTSFDDLKVTHLAPAGDLTGDGKDDLIVGTENYLVFAVNGNGWGTGDVLWFFNTCPDNNNCGAISGVNGLFETALATGHDLDGDEVPDVIFSTGGGNDHVYALSGVDGSVIWEVGSDDDPFLAPYYSVAARFDVTGDGVPDIVTGTGSASDQSPNPFNEHRVFALNGATGELLWERLLSDRIYTTEQIRLADGTVLAVAGYSGVVDGFIYAWTADEGELVWSHEIGPAWLPLLAPYPGEDGGEDVLWTGGSLANEEGLTERIDGATGEFVWAEFEDGASFAITVPGDLNGNGSADIAIGQVGFNGESFAYDGTDGSTIWRRDDISAFGLKGLRDATGDGTSDIAAATGDGRALLLSGADGSTVWTYAIGNGTLDEAAEVVAVVPDIDGNGAPEIAVGARHGRVALLASTGAVLTDADADTTPTAFALDANYPNPFGTSTTIRYTLSEATDVRLAVYDLLGRRVRTLVAEPQAAGSYSVTWDGRSASGGPSASGVYLYRLEAGDVAETRRLVLVR